MTSEEKLSVKERHLLARGNELHRAGEYDLALGFFQQGLKLNPDSQQLELASHLASQELAKTKHAARARRQAHAAREERLAFPQIDEEEVTSAAQDNEVVSSARQEDEDSGSDSGSDSYVPRARDSPDQYPHLSAREKFLLRRGNALFKQRDYDAARHYFRTGLALRPEAEEFEFALFLADEQLKKLEEGRKAAKRAAKPAETPAPAPTPDLKEDLTSRSSTAAEMDQYFLTRHRLIRKHAERAYRAGEFDTALALYEQGHVMLPQSDIFKKGKDKTQDAILVASGKKSPGPELLQKLVIIEIVKAQDLFKEKKYKDAIEQCKHIITRVQELHADKVEGKEDLMTSCFSIIGNCYFEMDELSKAMVYHMKDVELSAELNMDEAKVRGLANVGRVFAKQGDYVNAIRVWTEKMALPVPQDEREKAWLTHEVGCCYLEINDPGSAVTMATLSMETAEKAGDQAKVINAAVLQGQAHMRLGDPYKAKESFEKAVKVARETGEEETVAKVQPVVDELTEKIYELDTKQYGGIPGSPVY